MYLIGGVAQKRKKLSSSAIRKSYQLIRWPAYVIQLKWIDTDNTFCH